MPIHKETIVIYTGGFFSFLCLLTLIFAAAKVTGHLDWHWMWVFSPFWIPCFVFAAVICVLATATVTGLILACIVIFFFHLKDQRRIRKQSKQEKPLVCTGIQE